MRAARLVAAGCLAGLLAPAPPAFSVVMTVEYGDTEGSGFFDPHLGPARRAAFEHALSLWEELLAGEVPVVVSASMESLGGTGSGALLASGGPFIVHRGFEGSLPETWYAAALANQIAGFDVSGPDFPEIAIVFNADIDEPDVLGSIDWYYGTDAFPGYDVDFVTVALHEIGHGLGFISFVDGVSGELLTGSGEPSIFERRLFRPGVGRYAELLPAERAAAVVESNLLWDGPNVQTFFGMSAPVFTPPGFSPGSSVGHWDPDALPGELMAPNNQGANHDFGLLLPALLDMGWKRRSTTPTPWPRQATPTATATPTSTRAATPVRTPPQRSDRLYVANFDDDTVTVIEGNSVVATIPVGDGPAGVAASPDGRRVYIAGFRDGTVATISTRTNQVVASHAIGASANGIAVTADGRNLVVTDTFVDDVVVVDADDFGIRHRVAVGRAPGGVAIGGDGRAYVLPYADANVTVVDIDRGLRRAILPAGSANLLSIDIDTDGRAFVVGLGSSERVHRFNLSDLRMQSRVTGVPDQATTVAVGRSRSEVYVAGQFSDGRRSLFILDKERLTALRALGAGLAPEASAISSDEVRLFVTSAGENSVRVFNLDRRTRVADIGVGSFPIALAVASVPDLCDGDCSGDRQVSVDELILAVAIATGETGVDACDAGDANDDRRITVDEVVAAVGSALSGCDP